MVDFVKSFRQINCTYINSRPSGVPRGFGARGEDGNWRPSACQTGKRRRRCPSLLRGLHGAKPQPPTLWGAFRCKWNPFLNSVNTIFNSACHTCKHRRRSPSLLGGGGVWGGAPAANALGALGCKWNPFLNTINTIFNLACQTGERRWRSPSLLGVWGGAPAAITLLGAFGCKLNPFFNSVNTIFNSFGANCEPAAS